MAIENYKSFVLDNLEEVEKETKEKAKVQKKKAEINYIIEGISGPDMIIKKTSSRKEEQLILLVSQNQFYIKDLKKGTIEKLTAESMNTFLSAWNENIELTDIDGNQYTWLDKFSKAMAFSRCFMKLVEDENIRQYITKGYFWGNLLHIRENDLNIYTKIFDINEIKIVYDLVHDNDKLLFRKILSNYITNGSSYRYGNTINSLSGYDKEEVEKISTLLDYINTSNGTYYHSKAGIKLLEAQYGLDGVRKIISEYFNTAVSKFPTYRDIDALLGGKGRYDMTARYTTTLRYTTTFDIDKLTNYLFYESVHQGFAFTISNFIDMWKDTLAMQVAIYKEGIREKYPEALATLHQILSYKYELVKQQINEELWNKQAEKMSQYERHGEKYSIIAPKDPQDMIDEARMQSNCLSSYVSKVTNGQCMIFFLRKTNEIDKSLITIEIRGDNTLGQVKAKFNREPSYEERQYVEKWYQDKFLKPLTE